MSPDASVNTIRVFEDGDYVFGHTEYNSSDYASDYDLFRIEKGRIDEHWDTLEAIPPRDQWKNSNGKF